MRQRKGKNKTCLACGNEFYVPMYRADTAKFCSFKCLNHKQYEDIVNHYTCERCGKEYTASPSRKKRRFCSDLCKNKTGTTELERRRKSKKISNAKRGNNTSRNARKIAFSSHIKQCMHCGYDEHDFCLDVHHVDCNANNNEESNLAILCVMCHRCLHKKIYVEDIIKSVNIALSEAKKKPRKGKK